MSRLAPLVVMCLGLVVDDPKAAQPATALFEAPKFGLKVKLPKEWSIVEREKGDQVFVALIQQQDEGRPGVAACELGLAPESLDEYRTRIDANANRGRLTSGKAREECDRERSEWRLGSKLSGEFRPKPGELCRVQEGEHHAGS